MKTLRDYIAETDAWSSNPVPGDEFDIELAPDSLIESWVVDVVEDGVVLAADEPMMALLENQGLLSERIARYGAVGSSPGMGHSLTEEPVPEISDNSEIDEQAMRRVLELAGLASTLPIQPNPNAARTDPLAAKAADLAPVGTEKDPGTATTIDEGVMSEIAIELGEIADAEDYDRLYDLLTARTPAGQMVQKIADDITIDHRLRDDDHERLLELVMDYIVDEFGGQLDEAEYQGRKVPLGKPMRGDVKKFKVYVKDPKTGNVKKVNFGHGGKSARRAGEKTLSIKKSNPARRKSFRARHRCDTAKDRTTARYWSCRMW